MINPDAILTADWHIRATVPRSRTDDFIAVMWSKIQFILDLSAELDIPIILAGDLGQHHQWPNWLLEKFIRMINAHRSIIIAIAGQHDLPEHSLDLIPKSGLGVLYQSEAIVDPRRFNRISIDYYPYGVEVEPSKKAKMAVMHRMVIEDKPEWPGQVADSAISMLKKYPQYRIILTGDNHRPFVVKYRNRILVNPGSMMRTTAAQIDHRPRVYLWRQENNEVEPVYLPIVPEVLDRSHIDREKIRDDRIEAYTKRLSEKYEVGLSFVKNLEAHFAANRSRKQVKQRVWEACEK